MITMVINGVVVQVHENAEMKIGGLYMPVSPGRLYSVANSSVEVDARSTNA